MTPCWIWTGSVATGGYGSITYQGKPWRAHRLAYTLQVGPIPEGHDLHHRCGVPACVNPAHLQPVPISEHRRAHHPASETCQRGHAMIDAIVYPDGQRTCRPCRLVWARRYHAERMATDPAYRERRRARQRVAARNYRRKRVG